MKRDLWIHVWIGVVVIIGLLLLCVPLRDNNVILVTLVYCAVAVGFAVRESFRVHRWIHLLHYGVETTCSEIERDIKTSDDSVKYRITVAYRTIDGAPFTHTFTTTDSRPTLENRPLFYDPFDPKRAIATDELPGRVGLAITGEGAPVAVQTSSISPSVQPEKTTSDEPAIVMAQRSQ